LHYRAKDLLFMGILVKVFLIEMKENLTTLTEDQSFAVPEEVTMG
jgi:hypothetical protein